MATRRLLTLAAAATLLLACGDDPAPGEATTDASPADEGTADAGTPDPGPMGPVAFCEGPTRWLWEPTSGAALDAFPDDFYITPDPATPTGLRVALGDPEPAWLSAFDPAVGDVYRQLEALDGWGTSAGLYLRFSGPIAEPPSGDVDSLSSPALQLWQLGGAAPTRVPYEAYVVDDGTQLVLWPMVPLAEGTRHALVATTALLDADGACIAPSATLQAVVRRDTDDPRLTPLVPRYGELLDATGLTPEELSAALVFTTQTVTATSATVAAEIATSTYAWEATPTCTPKGSYVECVGAFQAKRYAGDDGIIRSATPTGTYRLPATVWLPLPSVAGGPHPVMVFGHGFQGDRSNGWPLAQGFCPEGWVVVSLDAVKHGEHPTAPPGADLASTMFSFFEADPSAVTWSPLAMRDNFRQSAWDKLQLLRLLEQIPDVDGDGAPDVDLERVVYYGYSLGGIMGVELTALSKLVDAAVLVVPGGRLSSIVREAQAFGMIALLVLQLLETEAAVERFYPVFQTLVEAGDAVMYGRHLVADRLAGPEVPPAQVLLQMAIGDEVVPNVTTRALARAAGTPVTRPVFQTVGVIDEIDAPVQGNVGGGAATAALTQFDRVTLSQGGAPEPASHNGVVGSYEAGTQAYRFLATSLEGPAEVVDPYLLLGTPPLP